ncbi:MAG: rhomboid family intramembrane serine protease [Pseudomonadota bacterium]
MVPNSEEANPDAGDRTPREPVFNIPGAIAGAIALLCLIHGLRLFLSPRDDLWLLYAFGFVPLRYDPSVVLNFTFPLEPVGAWVAPATHALLHASFVHLAVNALWLIAFGAPLARRFGAVRFALFSGLAAVAGACAHLAAHWGSDVPMVGASGVVSAYMAAAMRFCFEPLGPLSAAGRRFPEQGALVPRASLLVVWSNPLALTFALIFLVVNLGVGFVGGAADGGQVAWQAHIGGFAFGLFAFALFDPVRTVRR